MAVPPTLYAGRLKQAIIDELAADAEATLQPYVDDAETAASTATTQAGIATAGAAVATQAVQLRTVEIRSGEVSWQVPDDFAGIVAAEAIGEGGNGSYSKNGTPGWTGAGGGGGSWMQITSLVNIAAGDALSVNVGSGGSGTFTQIYDNTGTLVLSADYGRNAFDNTVAAGGLTSNGVGTGYNGGSGGTGIAAGTATRGGGGGGGAGSPNGAGGNGVNAVSTTTGAGAGGISGSGLAGGSAASSADAAYGLNGSEWINEGDRKVGSGSGGGSASSAFRGGNGGLFGAGGGGAGVNNSNSSNGGLGAPGVIRIRYLATTADLTTPYDIILAIGQSNTAGRGAFDGTEVNHPLVSQWVISSPNNGLYPPGLSATDQATITRNAKRFAWAEGYISSGQYSFVNRFAKDYAERTGRRTLVIPMAIGSTTIDTWRPGGANYTRAIAEANAAIAAAVSAAPGSKLVGCVWVQGEADAGATTAVYQPKMLDVIDSYRANVTGGAGTWFLIGGLCAERILINAQAVAIGHMRMPFLRSKTMYANHLYGFTQSDNLHYLRQGYDTMANRFGRALEKIDKPEIIYDFLDGSLTGTLPIGTTNVSNVCAPATYLQTATSPVGVIQKALTASGTFSVTDFMQVILECYDPTITNQVVEWVDSFVAGSGGLGGVTLRSQTGASVVGGTAYGKQGYQLRVNQSAGTWMLNRLDASAEIVLASGSLAAVSGRRFRVSAIGTTISAAYSDDSGMTWTTLGSATDATYSAGQAAIGMFNGTTAGNTIYDRVVCRTSI